MHLRCGLKSLRFEGLDLVQLSVSYMKISNNPTISNVSKKTNEKK